MEFILSRPINFRVKISYFKRAGIWSAGHRKIFVGTSGALNPGYGKLVTKANIHRRRKLT